MNLVDVTRCFTYEAAIALFFVSGVQAQALDAQVRVGSGWVDNPFFDDDGIRRTSALAGSTHHGAGRFELRAPFSRRQAFRGAVRGELVYFGGDEPAWMRRARLDAGWQLDLEDWRFDVMAVGRHYGIDRFPTDTRWGVGAEARLAHALAPKWRWDAALSWTWRGYPERLDVEADGSVQSDDRAAADASITAGPWGLGPTRWWIVTGGSVFHVGSNAPSLARSGWTGRLGVLGALSRWSWGVTGSGWGLAFDSTTRQDIAGQIDAFVGPSLPGGISVFANSQWTRSDSTDSAGRFSRWQAGVDVAWRWGSTPPAPRLEDVGVHPIAGGRWRFVMHAPRAQRVELVGDVNGWQRGRHVLQPQPNGQWVLETELPQGRNTFMYLIDGERWITPRGVARLPDGFGREVGVVWVVR